MKIGYELTIEQTQKLAMTPELIQAIRILQFNNQELNEYIGNELLENPVLESEKADDDRVIDIDALRDKMISNRISSGRALLHLRTITRSSSMWRSGTALWSTFLFSSSFRDLVKMTRK